MAAEKMKFILLGLGVIGLGTLLGTALWLRLGPATPWQGASVDSAEELNQYGSVPDFTLTERNGNSVNLSQLRGKIWIADFIYTTCTDTCPLQTAMMAKLQREYAGTPDVRFVSFTVDPERDTPQVLSRYADSHQADSSRWYFLTGQRNRIIRLIQEGFHLAVASAATEPDQGGMIPHSPRFVLVDKEARIRGYYDSRDLEAFLRLKNHIAVLVKG
jgi:protein SCO1/2